MRSGFPAFVQIYYDTEGHGFYTLPHRQEYHAQLLAFLGRNLQPEPAPTPSP